MSPRRREMGCGFFVWIGLAASLLAQGDASVSDRSTGNWSIAIHGGAGADPSKWTEEQLKLRLVSLEKSLQVGVGKLKAGAEAMDVVEAVVRALEDDPFYNAGKGAVLNEHGDAVLDASIMDGRDLSCGAIAGVRRIRNPITAARRIISETTHVFLTGEGADQFAEKIGLEMVDGEYFKTPDQLKNYQEWQRREAARGSTTQAERLAVDDPLFYLGTVGCVVCDGKGNLAAGTSTGGLLGKRFGRVGDSPVIGAGTYAKNGACAVSCTGTGEYYIRNVIAATIAAKMELAGKSLHDATQEAIFKVLPEDSGGLIAVDSKGNIEVPFNTPGMARGMANSQGMFKVAIGKDQ